MPAARSTAAGPAVLGPALPAPAAVWSLWTRPMRAGGRRSGWATERDHLLSWILSVESGRRHFGRTRLVADGPGAELLVDGLGLAFDEVTLELDALEGVDPDLWALGKLHAYRAQSAPFLHIDSDVYLWDAPALDWPGAGLFAAYPEFVGYGASGYRCASLRADIHAAGGWLPEELDAYMPHGGVLRAENCGVLGGSCPGFVAHYVDQAMRMLEHPANQPVWARRRPLTTDMLIFEQHLLSACLDYHRNRPGSPFAGIGVSYLFGSEAEAFESGGRAGFTHVIADTKHHPEVRARLAARVEREHPDLFRRCLALCPREEAA
ncbi:DUF6734 family protein [Roseomonas populi]|uniref:DUF6734 domain-containing protein n=1 Tax=Roseomonas populi TaxID=3121582 RepID=A0ABT1X4W4_9PROT|nr:DUF6734 family protein [Roseomonas pecuniae]MCR0982764.1 hypothetical protein [Roseomonas pecuniae]